MRKIDIENSDHTHALLQCLRTSPLLVDHLPEAVCFDRGKFSDREEIPQLNYAQKLGHLYEDALEYLLSHVPDMNLLGKSIQIFNEKKITLGELDYLLEDTLTGEFIHLELAVKFYLVRYEKDGAIFPGPDPRDNWLNKLERLREHQLKLTDSSEGKKFLLGEYGISKITSQQLIYGKLFDHCRAVERPCPPAMHPDCQRGTWKYLSEWQQHCSENEVIIIPKYLWPVELGDLLFSLSPVSRDEFLSEASERCTMIWDMESNDTQFIAPDTWS